MQIHLLSIGKRMPQWVADGFEEYARRMPADFRLQLIELPMEKRSKGADVVRLVRQEGERMLTAIPDGSRVIALDERGQSWNTSQLADHLRDWHDESRDISLLIGGPDGLSPECLAKAESRWSLSPLTLPHPLVRVVLAEQLYRAWTVLAHHPYHRA